METFLFGVWVGTVMSLLIMWWAMRRARQRAEAYVEKLEKFHRTLKTYQESQVQARVEKHGENFYMYDAQSDRFLAQGRDAAEILSKIPKNQTMHIVSGDAAVVQQFAAGVPQDD